MRRMLIVLALLVFVLALFGGCIGTRSARPAARSACPGTWSAACSSDTWSAACGSDTWSATSGSNAWSAAGSHGTRNAFGSTGGRCAASAWCTNSPGRASCSSVGEGQQGGKGS